jgi:hypothetical protein
MTAARRHQALPASPTSRGVRPDCASKIAGPGDLGPLRIAGIRRGRPCGGRFPATIRLSRPDGGIQPMVRRRWLREPASGDSGPLRGVPAGIRGITGNAAA